MVKQPIGNHGLGMFLCGWIWPWTPSSRSFFKYVLTYFLHLNSYLVPFLHNTICRVFLSFSSVIFRISFEHAVQLPFTVLLYSTFPDNYAFLSLLPSQGPRWQSGNTLASLLWGWGSIPVMALSGKAGSCLPLIGSLQYRTLANCMY